MVGLDHDIAEAGARRDLDLVEVELAGLLRLRGHLLVALETRLTLRLAGTRAGAHPVELVSEALLELGVALALDLQASRLLLQVDGVVALVGVRVAAVELKDPLGDVVEEVAIVGDGDDGAGVLLEVLLEPLHALGVEVVGRLVEQEQVGLLQEQLAQRHTTLLATGEHAHVGIGRGAAQGVHRLLELRVEVPGIAVVDLLLELAHFRHQGVEVRIGIGHLGRDVVEAVDHGLGLRHALLDVFQDGLGLVEHGLLHEDAHGEARGENRVAIGHLVDAGHDLEERGLARAVGADHADLGSRQEGQRHVVEDDLVAVRLACLAEGVDELGHRARA